MTPTARHEYPLVSVSVYPQQPAPLVDKISDDEIYYGYANMGTSEDDEAWLIVRVTVDGTVTRTEYPNASMAVNQKWSDRATLSYAR